MTGHAPEVSVVATVLNEAATIDALLDSLRAQTLQPEEIVLCDAGSDDATPQRIADAASGDPRIRLIEQPGNRSFGRNTAIASARSPIIATIDGGCVADADWLEHLAAPLAGGASWAGGFYRVAADSAVGEAIGLTLVPVIEEVDGGRFLPSARSMAFTVEAWQRVGGFPEHLDYAEDTAFDEAMYAAGLSASFVPAAVVSWVPPRRPTALLTTAFRWGKGDGVAGLRGSHYRRILIRWAAVGVVAVAAAFVDVRLVPIAVLPLAPAAVRETRHKYRHVRRPLTKVLLPIAQTAASLASGLGFIRGRLQR